jgi:hypothetical protein
MSVGVGYEWDAAIITATGRYEVPKETRDLIEMVWSKADRSPFHIKEKDDLGPPPRDWKQRLKSYVESIMPSGSQGTS